MGLPREEWGRIEIWGDAMIGEQARQTLARAGRIRRICYGTALHTGHAVRH